MKVNNNVNAGSFSLWVKQVKIVKLTISFV